MAIFFLIFQNRFHVKSERWKILKFPHSVLDKFCRLWLYSVANIENRRKSKDDGSQSRKSSSQKAPILDEVRRNSQCCQLCIIPFFRKLKFMAKWRAVWKIKDFSTTNIDLMWNRVILQIVEVQKCWFFDNLGVVNFVILVKVSPYM